MKPRVSVFTIAVADLERAVTFYRNGLGLKTPGIIGTEIEHGAVAFFDLDGGSKLALWPRKSLTHDSGVTPSPSASEFTLGHNVRSKEQVDEVMAEAERAGARIVKPARDTSWGGYSGYFADPDGHLWEVVYNPEFLPED